MSSPRRNASADKGPVAGIPSVKTCMICHDSIATDRPNIIKITNEYYKKGIDLPWQRVYGFTPEVHVRCENGVLEIFLQRATANGRDLPAWMLRDLRKQNLAVKLYDNPDARDALKHISSISLGDGAATLTTEGK